jgi:beta-mannosidase
VLAGRLLTSAALAADAASPAAFAQVRDGSSVAAAIDLGGPWRFKATDETEWMEARVPGTVHTDLLRAGRLPDPFYRDNELKGQWVEAKEWEYRRSFEVDAAFLRHDRVVLECRGLDTIAEVSLNGRLVARAVNMFVEHELDAKPHLRPGRNEIRIVFRSVLDWTREQKASDPRTRAICPEGDRRTDCRKGLLFLARKEASDFGWDWSPRLLTCGIWKPVRLAAYDTGRIAELLIRQDLTDPRAALLGVSAAIERFRARALRLEVTVSLGARTVSRTTLPVDRGAARGLLTIRDPELWWPLGWGHQPLYTVAASLKDGPKTVHTKRLRIGLRTIELVRDRDERGERFGFKVNGHPIFAKGANWVPADVFPDRLTEAQYRQLLDSVAAAHMNMIRVWGGGLYEADVFYELCDEKGILIWQDFMFAVGPYVATEAYLENVRNEVRGVLLRRRHHPSIALWCGDNESEANMAGVQNWTRLYPTASWEDYDRIFHELIPGLVRRHDPDRPYWPSSPHHPLDRERKSADWETSSGDAHDWEVWHGGRTFDWFEQLSRYRFASEFGFESLPPLETIRSFTRPEERCSPRTSPSSPRRSTSSSRSRACSTRSSGGTGAFWSRSARTASRPSWSWGCAADTPASPTTSSTCRRARAGKWRWCSSTAARRS